MASILSFSTIPTIYCVEQVNKNLKDKMQYKRQYRELDDDTKEKIRQSSKGKPKTADHKAHISRGMYKYWDSVPNKPSSGWSI